MQPLYEVTLTRPWHWGIAIVSAVGAEVPESLSGVFATTSQDALVLRVRHAQDIDAEVFEGNWDWATATLRVRSLTDFDADDAPVHQGVLRLPGGRLMIGDADSEVTVNDLNENTRIRVYLDAEDGQGPTAIRIDLAPSI
jgi:hypothetical protein